jgi:hypothetical protein
MQAASIAAGVAAAVLETDPFANPARVREVLISSASTTLLSSMGVNSTRRVIQMPFTKAFE